MFTTGYLRQQSAKFLELAAAARQIAEQEEYGALSNAYEWLAETLSNEEEKIGPRTDANAA